MKRIPLSKSHPILAKEWHPTKNGSLTPNDVTRGSDKKVWWICSKGKEHEWMATISSRSYNFAKHGCPICSGKRVSSFNCLAAIYPKLAEEWHPIKNKPLTPYKIVAGSGKKVWWKCSRGSDHEWTATIDNRRRGTGCPFCSNKKVAESNCLTTTHPKIAKEWHSTKNGGLTPRDVTSGSHKKVWWKCFKGPDHEWTATIKSRSNGIGCPICSNRIAKISNCLTTTHPKIAKEWHPTKNGDLTPYDVTSGSQKKYGGNVLIVLTMYGLQSLQVDQLEKIAPFVLVKK